MSTEITRRGLLARAGALAVAGPAALAAGTIGARAQDAEVNAFFAAGYDYCQAEKLGQYWSMSPWDAKINGGAKILRGEAKFLRQAARKAAKRFGCSTGFNYRDSDTLAEFWKNA
ncbi:MAG: hypothetical protein KL863_09525 [Rhizobium sp.]|nr:hypothetical protein [Rhizobium sp.]